MIDLRNLNRKVKKGKKIGESARFRPIGGDMAMIECSECHAEISSKATACPKCGNPQSASSAKPKHSSTSNFLYILSWIAVGVVGFLVVGVLNKPTSGDPSASSQSSYTGRLKIDAGTEYAALNVPSPIGGACDGWKTVEIRKPGMAGTGTSNLICWKRDGDTIIVTDRTGSQRKSGAASIWSD